MKRLLLSLLFAVAAISSVSAQLLVEGSLTPLRKADRVNLKIDFSEASIHGMSENAFAKYETDWDVDKPVIVGYFLSEARQKCGDLINLGTYENADCEIRVNVISINEKGNYVCEADVYDAEGKVIAKIKDISAKGGHFGTKLNLIKDGAKHTGAALGKFLKNRARR